MEATSPLVKTVSLPAISDMVMNVPISMVVQPDPAIPPAVLIGSIPTDVIGGGGGRVTSMSQLNDAASSTMIHHNEFKLAGAGGGLQTFQTLPRSRSLVSCQTHKIMSGSSAAAAAGPRLQLFRNLHLARAHMFHVRVLIQVWCWATNTFVKMMLWHYCFPGGSSLPLDPICSNSSTHHDPDVGFHPPNRHHYSVASRLWRWEWVRSELWTCRDSVAILDYSHAINSPPSGHTRYSNLCLWLKGI